MKKIIRLTERDLTILVKRIVSEDMEENTLYSDIMGLIRNSNSSHEETIDVLNSIVDEMSSSRRLRRDVEKRFRDDMNENEDIDRLLQNIVRGFRTEDPKDSTALISDIVELIENSEDVNDFKMKIKKYTKNNQEDFNKLSDDERDDIDRFINSIITRHDFN